MGPDTEVWLRGAECVVKNCVCVAGTLLFEVEVRKMEDLEVLCDGPEDRLLVLMVIGLVWLVVLFVCMVE